MTESRGAKMTYSCFQLSLDGGVAHLRLNRPEKLNSMIPAFWVELPQAVAEVEQSGEARVLLISSTGKHFTAGMDLSVFQSDSIVGGETPLDREHLRRLILSLQNAFNCLEQCRLPVIAAVQGGCIGGGVDMVCACDLRYATASAFFSIQEINLGMMADLGTLQRLPKLIPEGIVRELAYTGDRLSAERARVLGLVNDLFETEEQMLEQAMAVARKIAEHPPLAIAATKEAITYVRDHSIADALRQAATWQAAIFSQSDLAESFQSKKEDRLPVFGNLRPLKTGL